MRIAALVGDRRGIVEERQVDRELVILGVIKRWRDLIADAQRQRHLGRQAPRVVHVERRCVAQIPRAADGHGSLRLIQLPEQEIGEGIAAGSGSWVDGRVRLEGELATGELVAILIVMLAPEFSTEAECVLAADPREVVDKLKRAVVVRVRTFGGVADARVVVDGDVRDAPLNGVAGLQAWNAELRYDVLREGQIRSNRVEEARVTEAGFVDR